MEQTSGRTEGERERERERERVCVQGPATAGGGFLSTAPRFHDSESLRTPGPGAYEPADPYGQVFIITIIIVIIIIIIIIVIVIIIITY